jgi:hypothetical protein
MAIVIDVLQEKIVTINFETGQQVRHIDYTARSNGGTMYYWSRGGLDPLADLTTLVNNMATELYDDAAANGTAIPDLITWVFIEKKRKPVYRSGWSVVRNEVTDTGITNVSPTWDYQFHILQQLATDSALAANFQANAWRLGLIANKNVQITRAIIDGLTAQQRVTLYLLTLGFMGLGYTVGVDGDTVLEDYIP